MDEEYIRNFINATAEERKKQCEAQMKNSTTTDLEGLYCPMKFDGWSCWPVTPAGQTANLTCPDFIPGFEINFTVHYKCEEDGTWFFHPGHNKTWVDYNTCINLEDYSFRKMVTIIHSVVYFISLVALLVSLGLFCYFKSLRCARILIHMNLFASFAINNFLWLVWNYKVFDGETTFYNTKSCIALQVILYLFLISNYTWMLCEGLYLHTVLVWTFISERKLLLSMLFIGWGIPLVVTILYTILRSTLGTVEENSMCWLNESKFIIVQQIPVASTIILNAIFLINIVRVVVLKLRRGPANDGTGSGASRSSLQALRATLLLVPLLGLNFLLTPFRPDKGHSWEFAYEIITAVTASPQGLCVAILFCFCNGEVLAQIKRKWRTAMFRPRANSCTVTTVSFVRSSYPAKGEDKV